MSTRDSRSAAAAPAVTVVIPVYNGEAFLAEAIDSALAQSFRSFEIVVVNDGSADRSGAIAHAAARRHPDRIRVVDQPNAGLPGARNRALALGRGRYFALLDADDVWLPDHLQSAMDAFAADPSLGLVHANICRIDAQGAPLGVPVRRWAAEPDPYLAIALRREHVACPTAVFARECVQALGGFDPDFTGLGCEDRDLWLRIAERFRLRYLDAVVARYRIHPGNMSASRQRMGAARELLLRKQARSPRGARLQAHMRAMTLSDLGLEFGDEGRWREAIGAQLRALRIRPQTGVVWRRLLRLGWRALLPARRLGAAGAGR